MRTLVVKEIRLLLPALAGALALAIVPIWMVPHDPWEGNEGPALWPAYLYLFGTVLMALTSFGREIGLKTLPFILAQPLERTRIWWTKIAVLAVSVAVVFDAWLVSENIRCAFRPTLSLAPIELGGFGMLAVVFIASSLWMTLLLRQTVAAFWLTFLIPMAAVVVVKAFGGADWIIFTVLGVYAVAGFFLARRQFLHVQDTAWTGGVIVFGGARAAVERSALREHRPWAALLWKEVQLQQVTLVGMAGLLVLNLGVIALRKAGAHTFSRTTLMALDAFGALWFVVPLLAGSQSVAEERKFGTMQAHLCLPISRRVQWFLKLLITLAVGGLLSWALFWAMAGVAGIPHADPIFFTSALVYFLLLALAGFYGSSLTGGVVQALAAAVLMLVGCWACIMLPYLAQSDSRFPLCTGTLPFFVGWPLLLATLLWLAYHNFGNATESLPLWRRNALALAGMAALSFGLTLAIYHRAWEWLTPLEPPPGPARMSLAKPPVLYSYGGSGLGALLPEGRLWVDRLTHSQRWMIHGLSFGEKWMSLGGNEFTPGSNWVEAVVNSRETVAIRSDGALWVSAKPRPFWEGNGPPVVEPPAGLVQFGQDTNWLSAARRPDWAMFLLKRDGTLWDWGITSWDARHAQPSLRDFQPRRLGQDSDWARLLGATSPVYAFAWKTDGSAWMLHAPNSFQLPGTDISAQELQPGIGLSRLPSLDNYRWRCLISSEYNHIAFAGVRDDGTLWYWNYWHQSRPLRWGAWSTKAPPTNGWAPEQIGKDSDWAELAGSWDRLVARKTDGSLWKWEAPQYRYWEPFYVLHEPPVRLGTRRDWVALGVVGTDILSMGADGSLWSWPKPQPVGIFGYGSHLQLAASRKPAKIENVFAPME